MIKLNLKCIYDKDERQFDLPNKGLYIFGKTSKAFSWQLVDTIGAVKPLKQGEIIYNGVDLSTLSEAELANYRNNISVVSDSDGFEKTVRKTLLSHLLLQNKSLTDEEMKEVLASVGLDVKLDEVVDNLISSKKELLSLACALAKDSKIILVERFSVSITSEYKELLVLLRKFSGDRLIVLTSALAQALEPYCDGVITDANVIEENTPNEFLPKKDKLILKQLFSVTRKIISKQLFWGIFIPIIFALGLIFIAIQTSYAFYDPAPAVSAVAKEKGNTTARIRKQFEYRQTKYYIDGDQEIDLTGTTIYGNGKTIRDSQDINTAYDFLSKEDLNQLNDNNVSHKYYGYRNTSIIFDDYTKLPYYSNELKKIVEADADFVNDLYGMLAGNYPSEVNEILLPSYVANGILYGLSQEEGNYDYLLGKELTATVGNNASTLKICGVFKKDFDTDKYEILKDPDLDTKFVSSTKEEKEAYIEIVVDFVFENIDLQAFVSKGFFDQYPYKFSASGDNYVMKSLEEPTTSISMTTSFAHGYSGSYNPNAFIAFETIDFSNTDYHFYDLDGNEISNPTLEYAECYIPLACNDVKEDDFNDYINFIDYDYRGNIPLKLKGYYSNPYVSLLNPVILSSTFGNRKTYDIHAEYITNYEETREPYCAGAITKTDFTREQVNDLLQKGNGYSYSLVDYQWVQKAITQEYDAFLIWGIIFIATALLSSIIYCFSIMHSNFAVFLRRNGLSKSNLIKIVTASLSIVLLLSFVLSIIGTYVGTSILNNAENLRFKVNNVPFVHFGIFGYLINIGIVIGVFAIVMPLILIKKNKIDMLYYKHEDSSSHNSDSHKNMYVSAYDINQRQKDNI
ncbi:MAG: hypothetical protein K6B64_01220 [Acholeplasmatales bacterium]|nr:hypothetical protein [Acholeplasmatales bacterium]